MTESCIITARINELAMRDRNPYVPWSIDEIVADAISCADAGAASIHFHGRNPISGAPDNSDVAYEAAIRRIRAVTDLLIEPPLGFPFQAPSSSRADQACKLAADLATRPHIAALDVASVSLASYDAAGKTFKNAELLFANPISELVAFAGQLRSAGVKPVCVCWNVSSLRIVAALADMGMLDPPLWLALRFTEEGQLSGHPATPKGLRAFLDHLPDQATQWMAVGSPASLLPILDNVLEEGGHIGIGIGDYPYPELEHPDNATLIRYTAERIRRAGREVASISETKQLLGID